MFNNFHNSIAILIMTCFLGCHHSFIYYGNNKLEGFSNNKLEFKEYSEFENNFKALEGISLKLEEITFQNSYQDTVYNSFLNLSKFKGNVGLKVGKWNATGSISELYEANCEFEFICYDGEIKDLFRLMLDSSYQKINRNENIYMPRDNPMSYEIYRNDSKYLILKTYAPIGEIGYFEFFSSHKYLKITMPESHPESKRYSRWIMSYLFYPLTRGIKLKVGDEFIALDADHYLPDSSFAFLYKNGEIQP